MAFNPSVLRLYYYHNSEASSVSIVWTRDVARISEVKNVTAIFNNPSMNFPSVSILLRFSALQKVI